MSAVAGLTHQRYYVEEGCIILRPFSLFQLRDTSLRSLQYLRLHDAICVNEENYVMLEGDCIWCLAYRRIKDVPDPQRSQYNVVCGNSLPRGSYGRRAIGRLFIVFAVVVV